MSLVKPNRESFSKTLSQGRYYTYLSVDFCYEVYMVSGQLMDRNNEGQALKGILEAKHAIYRSKQITNINSSGEFSLRLKPGALYHLTLQVNNNPFTMDLDLH